MKIALVHDYLVQYGGAERVLESFTELWPEAPIYTLLYDEKKMGGHFSGKTIRTSFLQKMPLAKNYHRLFPPLMMLATEQFGLDYYDVVLSDSSSFAKNIITRPKTLHLSYCHTPMRFAWDDCQNYTKEFDFPVWLKKIVPFLMNYIRIWDHDSTNGVDHFMANSNFVQKRIQKYYARESVVISPPVDVDNFFVSPGEKIGDYYLLVGRMMKYKKMDLVIEAFNELKLPLKIVGRGMEYENLKKMAGPTIEFMGRVSDRELAGLYSSAQAFIFPQEEDFGLVAIEALASGRPVIAFRRGDIVENAKEGESGVFFFKQTKNDLKQAVLQFEKMFFDGQNIRQSVLKFDKKIFQSKMKEIVEKKWAEFGKSRKQKVEK